MESKQVVILILSIVLLAAVVVIAVIAYQLGKKNDAEKKYEALLQEHNLTVSGNPEPEKSEIVQTLWPMPSSYTSGSSTLKLSSNIQFAYPNSPLLDAAVARFQKNVFGSLPNNDSNYLSFR